MPFCQVSRLTDARRAAPSSASRPKRASTRALVGARGRRAFAPSSGAASSGSVAGFQTAVSMPLTMPVQRGAARAQIRPSRPMPNSARADLRGVGRADGGDRVGEREAGLQEADAAVILDAVDREGASAAGRARRRCWRGNWPWKARLWIGDDRAGARGRRGVARDRPAPAPACQSCAWSDVGQRSRRRAPQARSAAARPRAAKRRQLSGQSRAVGVDVGAARRGRRGAGASRTSRSRPADLRRRGAAPGRRAGRRRRGRPRALAERRHAPPDSRAAACVTVDAVRRERRRAARRRRRRGRRS